MSTIIDARYQVVTPLFCAGVDQDRPELRLPSFKGVLRFWWRALAWSRCQGDLRVIQREEDALFGSNAGGQSRVSMRLVPDFEPRTIGRGQVLRVPGTQLPVGEGARYLGYGGRGTAAGQLTRACLCAPLDFTVRMRGRNLNESQLQSLQEALFALGTLGSMGSKSRKGYGSLSLQSLSVDEEDEWSAPESMSNLGERIKAFQKAGDTTDFPEYTAFSKGTRHVLVSGNEQEQPLSLLDRVGKEFIRFRSSGYQGKALYRRASPMFIHLQLCGAQPVAVISFLPDRFLPRGRSEISVGNEKMSQATEGELYQPVHGFLDRLLDPDKRKEPFTAVVEV